MFAISFLLLLSLQSSLSWLSQQPSVSPTPAPTVGEADVIYSFDTNCRNVGLLYLTSYDCYFGNGATFQNGFVVLENSAFVSMDSAVSYLFSSSSNSQFTIELYSVTTSSYQSPAGSEFFIVMADDERNFVNLFNSNYGYLSIGVAVNGAFYSRATTSSFHSSGKRNYAVTIDMTAHVVILYLAGVELTRVTLPSSAQFTSAITTGTLNGYYDNPSYQLTYAAYDEVRLYSSVLSASEVLSNHQTSLLQTKTPTLAPTAAPTAIPSVAPSRLTKTPTTATTMQSQTGYGPSSSPTLVPSSGGAPRLLWHSDPSPSSSTAATPGLRSHTSSTSSSTTVNVVVVVLVLLCSAIGCLLYHFHSKRASAEKEDETAAPCLRSLFARGHSSSPSPPLVGSLLSLSVPVPALLPLPSRHSLSRPQNERDRPCDGRPSIWRMRHLLRPLTHSSPSPLYSHSLCR
jgi:hypothetical protein